MAAQATFKDFMITELGSRRIRSGAGEFLICEPTRDESGNICLSLNLPDSIKKQMLEAVKQGQFVRLFTPIGRRAS